MQHTCYLCQYMVTWSTFLSFSKVNQEFRGWEKSVHLFAREWIGFIWILTLSVTRICGTCPPLGMGSLSPSMDWPVYNGNLRQVDSRSAGIQQYGQVCLASQAARGLWQIAVDVQWHFPYCSVVSMTWSRNEWGFKCYMFYRF